MLRLNFSVGNLFQFINSELQPNLVRNYYIFNNIENRFDNNELGQAIVEVNR